jgi:hypothetical protein
MEQSGPGRDSGPRRPDGLAVGRMPPRYKIAIGASIILVLALILVAALLLSPAPTPRPSGAARERSASAPSRISALPTCAVACDPIDRRYLTDLPFGSTSFWIQPWRAYLDTWPASRLVDSLGINFNVKASAAQDVARLLHDSGFKLARIEIPWSSLSYGNPKRFVRERDVRTRLTALHDYGLRPLILLNANSTGPCPARKVALRTVSPSPAGAMTVQLDATSAATVVPGKTGFDSAVFRPDTQSRKGRGAQVKNHRPLTPAERQKRRAERRAAAKAGKTQLVLGANPVLLITKVSSRGVATLSKPLPGVLPAGAHKGTTLLYAPFASPTLSDGSPNPTFQATLHGWLSYVSTVSKEAESIFGPGGYDLEIWNELGFGSQFLNASKYYSPSSARASKAITKAVTKTLLDETVAFVRDRSHGISSRVGISDGFASQSPFSSGAFTPPGLTALSKHLYASAKNFPSEYQAKRGIVPRDAAGQGSTGSPRGSAASSTPPFVPHYRSDLPEYFLTATSTETVVRDLAPFTTKIYKAPHGRYVARPHQSPPQVWMTEYNLPSKGTPVGPDGVTPESSVALTPADKAHFEARALLRSLVAMVSKGMTREYFYAAAPGALSLISEAFSAAEQAHPGSYPGDQLGGETMTGFRNMLSQFQGPGPSGTPRQLKLLSIAQEGNHAQFTGDGTAAHPSLYDRDVLAVFPFQSSPTRFAIPVYVMTRDLLTLYHPNAPSTDINRFDLPDETFRITLGDLPETAEPPSVHAYDPLRNESTPVQLISRNGHTAVFQTAATDYPRILTIDYTGK